MKSKINKQSQSITMEITYANDSQKRAFPMEIILEAFKRGIERGHRFNKVDITFGEIVNVDKATTKRK